MKFNSINNNIITAIDAKTNANITEAKRRKLPRYKQEIKSFVIDEEYINELDWKTEQFRQEKEVVESDIKQQYQIFEEVKRKENEHYMKIKSVFDTVSQEETGVDDRIEEFTKAENEIIAAAESSISLLKDKLSAVTRSMTQLESICK